MDEDLKKSLEEVKNLVKEGKKEEALDIMNQLLANPDLKPYENALKKIKVDIIYALNLERIDDGLGKKAYEKVAAELDSTLIGKKVVPPRESTGPQPPPKQQSQKLPMTPVPPLAPVPVVAIKLPPELTSKDPYDIENMDIIDEIGPYGMINDIRRTIESIADPLLPIKMLTKEIKKKKR